MEQGCIYCIGTSLNWSLRPIVEQDWAKAPYGSAKLPPQFSLLRVISFGISQRTTKISKIRL